MTKRIYIIQSKTGKKKIYVNAASKNQALRFVMEEYFTAELATHEQLFEAFKDSTTEIIDVNKPDQADIEEVTGEPGEAA